MTMPAGLKITLSGTPATVLSFNDDVLECFFADGSTRIHVIHLKRIELAAGNGKLPLTVHSAGFI